MPTLSFDGSVYYSTAVDRRELVRIAPSLSVTMLMNRAQSSIAVNNTHEVNFSDLPGNKATVIMLSLSSGTIAVNVTDNTSHTATFNLTSSGMLILMNTLVTNLTITCTVAAVYDLIAGA